jgi:hypothetical protein
LISNPNNAVNARALSKALSFRSIGFRKRRQIFWKDDFAGLCPFFNLIADQMRPLRREQGADLDVFAQDIGLQKGPGVRQRAAYRPST